jgi:lipoate-protein ligase B
MEAWLMDALATYGVVAESIEGKTGVWVLGGQRKIASIGIAARHWVSYHGLAINLDVPAEPWRLIQPCGFESSVMVDLKELIRKSISEKEFADLLLSIAPKHFGDDVSWSDAEQK